MATIADDWQTMDAGDGSTAYYRRRVCYEMRWSVKLEESLVAIGTCGGPIAVTRDPRKLVKDTTGQKQNFIALFKSSGQFIQRIETPPQCIIHSMEWTQDELLCVVFTDSLIQLYSLMGDVRGSSSYEGTAAMTSFYPTGVMILTNKNVLKNCQFDPSRKMGRVISITPFAENLLTNLTQPPLYMHAFIPNKNDSDQLDYDDDEPSEVSCLLSPAVEDNLSETLYLLTEKDKVDLKTGMAFLPKNNNKLHYCRSQSVECSLCDDFTQHAVHGFIQ